MKKRIFLQSICLLVICVFTINHSNAQTKEKLVKSKGVPVVWDTVTKLKYGVSAGIAFVELNGQNYQNGYHYDFWGINTGGVIAGEVAYDIKNNPISLVADFSMLMSNIVMSQYDSSGTQINESVFRKFNISSLGLGVNIEGKYALAGVKYRIGYCGGGKNTDRLPFIPEVVQNGALNYRTNLYQSMEVSLGARYKQFQFVIKEAFPLTTPIMNKAGGLSGFLTASFSLGYTF